MGILRLWETLGRFIEETARMHFMLEGAAALITAIFVVLGWFPSPRLLRRVLFHGQRLSYPWAFKELLECLVTLWRIGPTHLFRPQSVRHGVRVWVEYEIFHQHHGAELPGFAPWRPKWWTVRVRRRRRESEADSQRAEAVRRFIETGQTSIKVDTCFAFRHEDTADAIERYLKAFADDERVFISTLVVKTAYVAPLRLLSGLLAHFKQDWVPVIDDFGAILARLDHPIGTSELRAIQAFIFDCWLLWGPSIPVCTCVAWTGNIEALQLGYGDENNSIPLVDRGTGMLDRFAELLKQVRREDPTKLQPLAIQVEVKGKLRWGLPSTDAPPALHGLVDDALVLEYESLAPVGGTYEEHQRLYYSAYLWIIFVVTDRNDRPVSPRTDAADLGEMWLGLLPFFEHGNIAEGAAYDFFKRQLAYKALAGLKRLVNEAPRRSFKYACAFDDPGCTPSKNESRRFPEPPGHALRAISEKLLATEFAELGRSGRVIFDGALGVGYSACHLTEMIGAFYKTVGPRSQRRPH